jgi:tetratricopeptide (TPR) repeat protein
MKTKLFSLAPRAATWTLVLSLGSFGVGVWRADAASPSELLEQGIYSEESKGDIDAAMNLYKQVIAESQAGQIQAAQAQYHLGLCLYKKKSFAEASAAFEKLIADYPTQTEWVARARDYLARSSVLLPAPWADGEELRLDLKLATGAKLGFTTYAMNSGELDGKKTWRLSSRLFAGVEQFSRVEVDADSMKPIHSRWKHSLLGDADAAYGADKVDIKMAGKSEVKNVAFEGFVYDNEEVAMGIRRLPLSPDYKANLRILTTLGGGNIIPITITVAGVEKVEVPAGVFDCYKVELSLVKQTFWYSTNANHYLVKFDATAVTAELAGIARRTAGSPVQYQGKGFSLATPAEWVVYDPESRTDKGNTSLLLLDPEITAASQLILTATNKLSETARKSPRAWAEEITGKQTNLKLRGSGWGERTVAQAPAVTFIGDYTEAGSDKVIYGVCGFVSGQAVEFLLTIAAKDFEDFRPKFDGIVNSYQAN